MESQWPSGLNWSSPGPSMPVSWTTGIGARALSVRVGHDDVAVGLAVGQQPAVGADGIARVVVIADAGVERDADRPAVGRELARIRGVLRRHREPPDHGDVFASGSATSQRHPAGHSCVLPGMLV